MSLSAPDGGTLESELEVFCRTEADLFNVDPGIAGSNHVALTGTGIVGIGNEGMAVQTAHQEFVAKRAGDIRQTGNAQRFHAVDMEGVDILRVIGVRKSRTPRR